MLSSVYASLRALNLPFDEHALRHYINITRGESMSLSVFYSARSFYQIKASEHADLQPEYAALQFAYARHPRLTPKPLGCGKFGAWSILVSEGMLHTGFPAHRLPAAEPRSGPVQDLLGYFAQAARQPVQDGGAALQGLLEHAGRHFAATQFAQRFESSVAALRCEILALPPVPQHGDFVLNNLACYDERLIVFDWEDMGKVTLPGFDLFTLVLSAHSNRAQALRVLLAQPAAAEPAWQRLLQEICRSIGLDPLLFARLTPLYLLLFLYLKRNYGLEVQQRIADAVAECPGAGC